MNVNQTPSEFTEWYGPGLDGTCPTLEQWGALLDRPVDKPLTLINFFKLRDAAKYEKEKEIIMRRIPGISNTLAENVTNVMQKLRDIDFYKRPGIAETLDWSRALFGLEVETIDDQLLQDTAGVVLKYRDDIDRLKGLGIENLMQGGANAQS